MKRSLDALLLVVLSAYILAGATLTPFHGDESTQIYMSRDFAYLFLLGQPEQVQYADPPLNATEQHLRLLNGVLNKYTIGGAWALAGFTPDDVNEQWDWGADWNYNQTSGHAPSADLLHVSRWPSAMFLVVGLLAVFALAGKTGGRSAAWIAAILYAMHPALLLNGRRAMMEGSLIAFTALTALAAVYWLEARGRREWVVAAVFGVVAGLALASKHTAVLAVLSLAMGALGFALFRAWGRGRRAVLTRLGQMVWAGLLGGLVFLALNPVWWSDPLARVPDVLRLRSDLLAGQTAAFGGFAGTLDALAGFARQVFAPAPQYFEVAGWDVWLAEPIASYEASGLAGITVSWFWVLAALMLGGTGLWALVRRPDHIEARWIVAVWFLSALAAVLLLTPIEWQRYYLPVYPALMVVMGVGGGWLVGQVNARVRRLRSAQATL